MSTALTMPEQTAVARYISGGGKVTKTGGNGNGSPPWGKTNEKRGLGYHDLAVAFLKNFSHGSTLTQDEFSEWAETTLHSERFQAWARAHDAFVNMPARGTPKNSDAWHAHLSRRHRLRHNINKAATHPRMNGAGNGGSFKIVSVGPNQLEVRVPPVALVRTNVEDREKARLKAKASQYAYLMQSTEWESIDPRIAVSVERVYEDIQRYIEDTETAARRLNASCVKADQALLAKGIGLPQIPAPVDAEEDDGVTEEDDHIDA